MRSKHWSFPAVRVNECSGALIYSRFAKGRTLRLHLSSCFLTTTLGGKQVMDKHDKVKPMPWWVIASSLATRLSVRKEPPEDGRYRLHP